MKLKPMIYIAGPITLPKGAGRQNAVNACRVAEQLVHECDIVPLIPHLSVFWCEVMEGPMVYCQTCGHRMEEHDSYRTCPDKAGTFILDPILGRYHYTEWIDMSQQWLMRCDAVFRMPGESKGSDGEVELAKKLNIPVFHSVNSVKSWIKQKYGARFVSEGDFQEVKVNHVA